MRQVGPPRNENCLIDKLTDRLVPNRDGQVGARILVKSNLAAQLTRDGEERRRSVSNTLMGVSCTGSGVSNTPPGVPNTLVGVSSTRAGVS